MVWRFAPDLPTDTPQTWRICDGFHADRYGVMRTGFMATSYDTHGAGSVASTGLAYRTAAGTLGIVVISPIGNPPSTFAKAYVYNGSWNDRAGASRSFACFTPNALAQFGNITLLADSTAGIFSRDATGTSNFASVAGSPTCTILLVTPQNIVIALNAIRAYSTDTAGSDAWAASDVGDYTNWSTNEAASGNLRQTPGTLTSGVVQGNDVIAFKRKGVYRGQYIGGVLKWKWDLIDASLGAWGPGCAVNAGGVVYFYGDDGFYSFDGSQFKKLDGGISTTIQTTIGDPSGFASTQNYRGLQLVYDSINRRIALFNMGSGGVSVPYIGRGAAQPRHFTYNIDSDCWGYQSKVTDVAADSSDTFQGIIGNASELNSFNSGVWKYNTNIALLSGTNSDIRILDAEFTSSNCGTNYVPSLTSSRIGQKNKMTLVTRAIPGWTRSDGAGTNLSGATVKQLTPITSSSAFGNTTNQTAVTLSDEQYWANYTHTARYHNVKIEINCEACIDGVEFVAKEFGAN